MAGVTMIAIGTGLAIGGQAASYIQQKKAQEQQKAANRTSQAQAQVENARARRQAIAQARIARAQNEAMMSPQVGTSSALTGAQSSISSQLGANLGAQTQRIGTQSRIQGLQQSAANYNARAGAYSVLGQTAQQAFTAGASSFSAPSTFVDTRATGATREAYTGDAFQTWLNR